MKKFISVLLVLCFVGLVGCSNSKDKGKTSFDENAYMAAVAKMKADMHGLFADLELQSSSYNFAEASQNPSTSAMFFDDDWTVTMNISNEDSEYTSISVMKDDPTDNEGMSDAFTYFMGVIGEESPYTYEAVAALGYDGFRVGSYEVKVSDSFEREDSYLTSCDISFRKLSE